MDDHPSSSGDHPSLNPELGRRLKDALKNKSKDEAAAIAGKSYRTLERYFAGHDASVDAVIKIAKATDTPVEAILFGDAPAPRTVANDDFVAVPRYAAALSAGGGAMVEGDIEVVEMVMFRRAWMKRIGVNPLQAHVIPVIGDSMQPTLVEGDVVLADTGDTDIVGGGIFVIVQAGHARVKRLTMRGDGSVMVISDNRDIYPPETVPAEGADNFRIVGRVRWYGRTVR